MQPRSSLMNDNFLRALKGEETPYTPVWMMRQAGRYLPEYKATRAKAGSFMNLCRSAELATEVTLQPLKRFKLDAAILFSDILTIPDAMGLNLTFIEGEGPKFSRSIRSFEEVDRLPIPDMEKDLGYVMNAVRSIRTALENKIPLIGFSGSPFTLACYMIEGGSSPGQEFRHAKTMMYHDPRTMHHLLKKNAQAVGEYLHTQIQAGAQTVMIFDSWGGMLSPKAYQEFSLPYIEEALSYFSESYEGNIIPRIIYVRGNAAIHSNLHELPIQGLGVDWTVDLPFLRKKIGNHITIQGNLDPSILFGSPEHIEKETKAILTQMAGDPRHIFNLGHGISQHTLPEHAKIMIDTVHDYSHKLREALRNH